MRRGSAYADGDYVTLPDSPNPICPIIGVQSILTNRDKTYDTMNRSYGVTDLYLQRDKNEITTP